MKRLFDNYVAVAAILCLSAVSCEKTGDGTFQDAELTVSPEVVEYNPSLPESNVFTVESNAGWKISTSHYMTVTDVVSGEAGTTEVRITAAAEGESKISVMSVPRGDGDRIISKSVTVRYDPSGTDEPDEPEEGEVVYYDDLDAVVTSDNYWIDQSNDYINKTGTGAASVEYSGLSVGIRNNYSSTGYQDASGDNAFYFGRDSWFVASGIELPAGISTFRISFGVAGDNVDKGSFTANEDLVLLIGNTATGDYRQVTYQRPGTSTSWGFAQADFRIGGELPQKLSIRLEGSWNVRVDDLKLCVLSGNVGQTVTFGPVSAYPWPELPVTLIQSEDYRYITHYATTVESGKRVRNYVACYDTGRHNPMWVASVHHDCYLEGWGRTDPDPWRPDPEMTGEEQSIIYPSDWEEWPWTANGGRPSDGYYFWTADYTDEYFTKGHLLRSDDRRGAGSEMNIQTFYPTNIAPEMYLHVWQENGEETSTWGIVEGLLSEEWTGNRDTTYVVTGCYYGDDSYTAVDASKAGETFQGRSKTCVVPVARYRVILKTKSGNTGKPVAECSADELTAIGFWYPQRFPGNSEYEPQESEWIFTVSEIEEKIGKSFSFFPEIPEQVKQSYERSDWPGL